MTITDVRITNFSPPGHEFWNNAESHPDQPLIEATVSMKMSWKEYQFLLNWEDRRGPLDEKKDA